VNERTEEEAEVAFIIGILAGWKVERSVENVEKRAEGAAAFALYMVVRNMLLRECGANLGTCG
jgi:hypothetical protein